MENKAFGKLISGAVRCAPMPLMVGGCAVFSNDEALHLENGYKPVVRSPEPDPVEGYIWVTEWVETDERIELSWKQVEISAGENDPTHIIDILTGEVE